MNTVIVTMLFGLLAAMPGHAQCPSRLFPSNRAKGGSATMFSVRCKPLVSTRLDPIVHPGTMSTHVHEISGNANFKATVKMFDLAAGSPTTCDVKQDASMYWFPALYLKLPDGTMRKIRSVAQPYYLAWGQSSSQKMHAFPKNFRVLAGDASKRGGSDKPQRMLMVDQHNTKVSWYCQGKNWLKHYEVFPPINNDCLFLRANIHFPTCWDSVSLDSVDHKQHTAFTDRFGNCPPTHPVLLPLLKLEALFMFRDLALPSNLYNSRNLILSNGDTTGSSFHGDFISGWDERFLVSQLNGCRPGPRGRASCPGRNMVNFHNIDVPIKNVMPGEEVHLVRKLPGVKM